MVDHERHTPQNGFGFYELFVHNINNIIMKLTQNIKFVITFIFDSTLVVKQDYFTRHLWKLSNIIL
jgi:hypothetical protein